MEIKADSEPIRQTSNLDPCPKCGSVYRRGVLCNACGEYCPEQRFAALGLTETKGDVCHDKQGLAK